MEKFAQQLLAAVRGELIEHVTGRIGERCAETEQLLVGAARIEADRIPRGAGSRLPAERRVLSVSLLTIVRRT